MILTATQVKGVTIGVAAAMLLTGVGGLVAILIIEEDVPALRAATIGGFAALLATGLITMIVATLRGLAAVIRHQAGIERVAIEHFADLATHQERLEKAARDHFEATAEMIDERIDNGIQDRLDQLEHLVVKVHELFKRQADVIGEVLEKQIELRDDELGRRRNHRSG